MYRPCRQFCSTLHRSEYTVFQGRLVEAIKLERDLFEAEGLGRSESSADLFSEGVGGSEEPVTSASVIYIGTVACVMGEVLATSSAALAALLAARNRLRSRRGSPQPHFVHLRSMCC